MGISGAPSKGMQAFDQRIADLMGTYSIPGLALTASRNGNRIIERGYGLLDTSDPASEATAQSSFRIASVSKPITAAALLKLFTQKVFTLDTLVFDLLKDEYPLLSGATFATGVDQITIRHLLQHSSGWSDDVYDPMLHVVDIANAVGTWPPPADRKKIIQHMWSVPLVNPPGTIYAYANFNYCLLGRVIEKFTGSYENFVTETVLQALGMASTFLATHLLADRRPGEARYYPNPGEPQVNSVYAPGKVDEPYGGFDIENMDSHGGWVSSPIDLVSFMNGVFGGFIDTNLITDPANSIQTPNGGSYGLGWGFSGSPGKFTFGHLGSLPGTSSVVVKTTWPDGADVCWAAVTNIRSSGSTLGRASAGKPFVSVFGEQQHFAWRDGNGTIWDAWFDSGNNSWNLQQVNTDPSPKPNGKTTGPPAASDPFVSVFGQQLHFAYLDKDGFVWDAWYDGGDGQWNLQWINMSPEAGTGPTSATGGVFVCVFGQQQHFVIRDKPTGGIWDGWYNGADGSWNTQFINGGSQGRTFAPPAAGDPFVSVFGQQQHFVYRETVDNALWDVWFNAANGAWNAQQITAGGPFAGLTAGPPPAGDPFVSVFGQQQHFVYSDLFGVIWDAWHDGGDGQWKLQQINAAGATTAPLLADPTDSRAIFVNTLSQQQHFAYGDQTGAIWDVWYDAGTNTWSQQRVNAGDRTKGPAAVSGPFTSVFGQQMHFTYTDEVGGIWDAWYDAANNAWNLQLINSESGEILSAALNSAMWDAMNTISDLASFTALP
jgi:CubicO group peptidase (beta-lactamase class C family)